MKDAVLALLRQRDGARAVGGEQAFELVAGGGADELARFRREDFVDGARVRLLDRLAGEDDGAAVDFVLLDARLPVGVGDELAELAGVDRAVRQEGRQHDRGTPHDAAVDDDEAAGETLRLALEDDLRKEQVRRGGADVDADRGQLDVFLLPDRLGDREPLLFAEFEMFISNSIS
jgi:hypothetical protein